MNKKDKTKCVPTKKSNDEDEFVEICGGKVFIIPEIERNIKNKK